MINDIVFFNYLMELINAAKIKGESVDKKFSFNYNNEGFSIGSARYLLSQTLRQLIIDEAHWHISANAKALLESKEIDTSYSFLLPYTINANKTLKSMHSKFNDVFMVEHVVPINCIMDELIEEKDLSYDKIANKLLQIHVCIITKDEDQALRDNGYSRKREGDFVYIINQGAYKKSGIILAE